MIGLAWKWRQPRRLHLNELSMEVNLELCFAPRRVHDNDNSNATSAAISPYSMAVAPDFISQKSPDGLYRTSMVLKGQLNLTA
jgi:hypothetical protein